MIVQTLAYCEQFRAWITPYVEAAKSKLRIWLGPEPINYTLLADGRVLPASISIPEHIGATAYTYHAETQQITQYGAANPEGRYRRLNTIALQVIDPIVGSVDMSDWLGEVRANPVPGLMPKQILNLWSAVHNTYVPVNGVNLRATHSDGTEYSYDI